MGNKTLIIPAVVGALSAFYEQDAPAAAVSVGTATCTAPSAFPTDVGMLGKIRDGANPFKAQEDKLNVTWTGDHPAIELRWLPKNAARDGARSEDIFRNLGPASPYSPAKDLFPETIPYEAVPAQCTVKQVHMIYRHGARYPTKGRKKGPGHVGKRIDKAKRHGAFEASGDLAFLNDWTYTLGKGKLVRQGGQDMFNAGAHAYYQYAELMDKLTEHKPVIRTTSQSRMLDSARYWSFGFVGWDAATKVELEVLPEGPAWNSTLSPKHACPNAHNKEKKLGRKRASVWGKEYLPALVERLQPMVKGLDLTTDDVFNMMALCAYETAALGYSAFCPVFTKTEYESFEYSFDLGFHGDHGFGSETGRAEGMGWVGEFSDRLAKKPFEGPITSQNGTVDSNATYFPLDQPVFVDFTHDTVLMAILTTLNMTQFDGTMDVHHPDPHRIFRASRVTPFGARLVFEVMECAEGETTTDYIRTKINEAIIPLNEDQGCTKRSDGLCRLDAFIAHTKKVYNAAHFAESCFAHPR